MRTTKRKLIPYEVVEHCPKCIHRDDVPLKDCELKLDATLMSNPPCYRTVCPVCEEVEILKKKPRRIEYEKGPFIV